MQLTPRYHNPITAFRTGCSPRLSVARRPRSLSLNASSTRAKKLRPPPRRCLVRIFNINPFAIHRSLGVVPSILHVCLNFEYKSQPRVLAMARGRHGERDDLIGIKVGWRRISARDNGIALPAVLEEPSVSKKSSRPPRFDV